MSSKLDYLVNSIKDSVSEYCYNVYGDPMREKDIINNELKSLGIINGEDEMAWKSPDKSLYFEASREDSSVKTLSDGGYRYVCTLSIKNNLKMPISEIKFTELDCIRILEGFVDFVYPEWYYNDNTVYIAINPNGNLDTYTIELSEIPIGDIKGVLFKITKYNTIYQQVVPVVTIPMEFVQLQNLAFHLFFSLLIDIEVPVEYEEVMYKIEDYILTDQYWELERRKNKLLQLQQHRPDIAQPINTYITCNESYIASNTSIPPMNYVVTPNEKQQYIQLSSNVRNNVKHKGNTNITNIKI